MQTHTSFISTGTHYDTPWANHGVYGPVKQRRSVMRPHMFTKAHIDHTRLIYFISIVKDIFYSIRNGHAVFRIKTYENDISFRSHTMA